MLPRVVSERRPAYKTRQPPEFTWHPWTTTRGGPVAPPVLVRRRVAREIVADARNGAAHGVETMGLLAGTVRRWDERPYAVATRMVRAPLQNTSVSVRFARDGLDALASGLEDAGRHAIIVGWYHSHPDLGCFLSATDLTTHRRMFAAPFHVAIVVDPARKDIAGFRGDPATGPGNPPVDTGVGITRPASGGQTPAA